MKEDKRAPALPPPQTHKGCGAGWRQSQAWPALGRYLGELPPAFQN